MLHYTKSSKFNSLTTYLWCLGPTGDNGSMYFWDWKTGYNFQKIQTTVQPGSLDSEAGIFQCRFDQSGCRLLTAEADKTIKIYKEDDTAVSLWCLIQQTVWLWLQELCVY